MLPTGEDDAVLAALSLSLQPLGIAADVPIGNDIALGRPSRRVGFVPVLGALVIGRVVVPGLVLYLRLLMADPIPVLGSAHTFLVPETGGIVREIFVESVS